MVSHEVQTLRDFFERPLRPHCRHWYKPQRMAALRLILLTCLISFASRDFENDTEQVPLALQIVAFLQTLLAS